MLSINQMNAQIKLSEFWKASNDSKHPFAVYFPRRETNARASRSYEKGCKPELGKSNPTQSTFINDGIKAWNKAPISIKQCKSFYSAKKEIRKFVSTLPI